jgi:membrane associated rhomboid family serine protease
VADMTTIIREILTGYERRPVLTVSLAIVLIFVFLLQQTHIILKEDYGFIPSQALTRPWIFVSSSFLHLHTFHLVSNVVALLWFGCWLELATSVKRKNILTTFFWLA